jgi:hypothetical protein
MKKNSSFCSFYLPIVAYLFFYPVNGFTTLPVISPSVQIWEVESLDGDQVTLNGKITVLVLLVRICYKQRESFNLNESLSAVSSYLKDLQFVMVCPGTR